MSEMSGYGIVLFHTTSMCMRAEKLLKKAGIPCKLVPPPRELSSDCGISVQFAWADEPQLVEVMKRESVETAGIHRLDP